jgi:hypothetical protein
LEIVQFNAPEELGEIAVGSRLDVRFKPSINAYRETFSFQLKAEEIVPAGRADWHEAS